MSRLSPSRNGRVARLRPLALLVSLISGASGAEPDRATPEDRALAFLAIEVPRWSKENRCFSCHNNGDAARALYTALEVGRPLASMVLADTNAWLAAPDRWDRNGGEGPFSDKRLARVQFTTALAAARRVGAVKGAKPLLDAARRLARDQGMDGSWPLEGDESGSPGSPATYGRRLATHLARESLRSADPAEFREPIQRAGAWLASAEIRTIPDAAVTLMALGADPSSMPPASRVASLDVLRKGQSDDGGWGPFVSSPPEVFDTALAILGLSAAELTAEGRAMIERGRSYLIASQHPGGSWTETTRPPGAESYAQRISTTGWATLALIESGQKLSGRGADAKR